MVVCCCLCHNRLDREPTCLGDIRVHYIGICDPSSPSRLEPVVIKGFLSALSSVWKERKITSAWAQSGGCFGNCTGLPGITCVRACHALSQPPGKPLAPRIAAHREVLTPAVFELAGHNSAGAATGPSNKCAGNFRP